MIAVVDYGAGNLMSVCNALDLLGQSYRIARTPSELDDVDGILLPGVGHFGAMMSALDESKMTQLLQAEAAEGTPLLGICLGMQAMFDGSEEAPGVRGLSLFDGHVRRFKDVPRIPHMGWNEVKFRGGNTETFYFANSFYAPVSEHTTGVAEYGVEFTAVVRRNNVSGVQFHPEKSGEAGLKLLQDWCLAC